MNFHYHCLFFFNIFQVNDIRKYSIDSQVLSLFNLRILDMSNNRIESIPKRLGELPLVRLNLSKNCLRKARYKDWLWIENATIKSTLQYIDLSENQLGYFPLDLVKLQKLNTLKLNNNKITQLPFAIRRLHSLRELLLADNHIETLPDVMTRMSLETVDLSGDTMFLNGPGYIAHPLPPPSFDGIFQEPSKLWQLAAQVVITKRFSSEYFRISNNYFFFDNNP